MTSDAAGAGSVWWEVRGFGRGRHPRGTAYRHDNAKRPRTGSWVVELVEEGRIAFEIGGGLLGPSGGAGRRRVALGPGSVFVFAYGEKSCYGVDGRLPAEHASRWVSLRGAGLGPHLDLLRREGWRRMAGQPRHGPLAAAVAAGMDRLIAAAAPGGGATPAEAAHEVHRFVATLLAEGGPGREPDERPVDHAVRSLLTRPHAPSSLKEVAAEHGVSREHLARVFAERVGEPPHRHLARRRVRHAIELLRCTGLPLAAVARQSGFATVQTLRRQVQRETGRSPAELRAG
ncbi:AraC family transcriptional regulator [Phycisphaera mikurensis]|uniref:AraC family transcriptional regulator n=1 Tax=Phycisphaera mikurensis TaxID=547188 RepID=UPI00069E4316|nr:helix-turn-helix transcriptional regulator [Phycisphaera mikurensis]MBB6442664.1 AraC-like DNA-binding protein [Phycisphaera mikurensis]